jgi:hypothetical protein
MALLPRGRFDTAGKLGLDHFQPGWNQCALLPRLGRARLLEKGALRAMPDGVKRELCAAEPTMSKSAAWQERITSADWAVLQKYAA